MESHEKTPLGENEWREKKLVGERSDAAAGKLHVTL